MSIISRDAGTLDFGLNRETKKSNLSSGIGTYAVFGSIVQNGQFSTSASKSDKMLKVELLPTFGNPTIPILSVFLTHPQNAFSSIFSFFFINFLYIK